MTLGLDFANATRKTLVRFSFILCWYLSVANRR